MYTSKISKESIMIQTIVTHANKWDRNMLT